MGKILYGYFDGDRIRIKRVCRKLTQRQLAELLSMTQATISEYETGRSSPSLQTLIKLAIALGTSTDYLLSLTNDPVSAISPERLQELLLLYQSLSPEKRERAIGILIGLQEG